MSISDVVFIFIVPLTQFIVLFFFQGAAVGLCCSVLFVRVLSVKTPTFCCIRKWKCESMQKGSICMRVVSFQPGSHELGGYKQ